MNDDLRMSTFDSEFSPMHLYVSLKYLLTFNRTSYDVNNIKSTSQNINTQE